MCHPGVGTLSAHEMTTGRVSHQQISPKKGQIVIYRPSIGPDSLRDARCATLVGKHRESSGESRLWLLGLLAMIALVGFFIALNLFFIAFLRREAHVSWAKTVILTAAADGILMFLSWLMTLDLPWGWLQHEFVDLPWPIGSI